MKLLCMASSALVRVYVPRREGSKELLASVGMSNTCASACQHETAGVTVPHSMVVECESSLRRLSGAASVLVHEACFARTRGSAYDTVCTSNLASTWRPRDRMISQGQSIRARDISMYGMEASSRGQQDMRGDGSTP